MSETLKGVVKWFNDAKGFGFIEHTSGRDVFVHYSVIEADGFKTLKDGEEVLYEIKEGPKGLHALRVQRVVEKEVTEGAADAGDSSESDSESDDTTLGDDDSSDDDDADEGDSVEVSR